jgi:pimeloyl-ACP methyl ester carboxylesterase
MKRAALATVAIALALFVYFRPLSVVFAARRVFLYAIGMRGHDVVVDGHRLHYLAGGDGPPLVLVHGVAMRAEDWAPLVRPLLHAHRVYAPDLLGYGDSDKPRDADYSIAAQSERVRGLLDALRIPRADVMGVSMGGWVSLALAAAHPERVRRLVLISSAGIRFQTSVRETTFSPRTIDQLRASLALQTDRAARLPAFVLRDFLRRSREKAWIVTTSMHAMFTGRDLLDGKLQRVRMPVLLVWGTADRIVPYSVAAAMQRQLPHTRLVTASGCGHLAVIECRDQILPPIGDFLR